MNCCCAGAREVGVDCASGAVPANLLKAALLAEASLVVGSVFKFTLAAGFALVE